MLLLLAILLFNKLCFSLGTNSNYNPKGLSNDHSFIWGLPVPFLFHGDNQSLGALFSNCWVFCLEAKHWKRTVLSEYMYIFLCNSFNKEKGESVNGSKKKIIPSRFFVLYTLTAKRYGEGVGGDTQTQLCLCVQELGWEPGADTLDSHASTKLYLHSSKISF